jgi:DNA polymerase-3 subunit delta
MVAKVSFRNASVQPLTLLVGANDYLASRGFAVIRSAVLDKFPETEQHIIEDGYEAGQLMSLASPSLFSEPRIIFIQTSNQQLLEDLKRFIQDPTDMTFIIIRVQGQSSVNKELLKLTAQQIDCDDLKKEQDRQGFLQAEMRQYGKSMAADAQRLLLQTFGSDLAELAAACSQLSQTEEELIDFEKVDSLFGGREQTTSFKVVDAAFAGDLQSALRLLRNARDAGIDPVPLVATVAMRARQLAKLISLPSASASDIGVADWQLRKLRSDLAGWSEGSLESLIRLIAHTDEMVKGGSRHPDYDLERLLIAVSEKTS